MDMGIGEFSCRIMHSSMCPNSPEFNAQALMAMLIYPAK